MNVGFFVQGTETVTQKHDSAEHTHKPHKVLMHCKINFFKWNGKILQNAAARNVLQTTNPLYVTVEYSSFHFSVIVNTLFLSNAN